MPSLLIQENGNYLGKVKVTRDKMTIGRQRSCDCCLDRNGVGKVHCEVFRYNNRLMLRDVSGGLGTVVNGVPITSPIPLDPGTEIKIADLVLTYLDDETEKAGGLAALRGTTRTERALSDTEKLSIVSALRKRLHTRLLRDRDLQQIDLSSPEDKIRDKAKKVAEAAISEMANEIPPWVDRAKLLRDVLDEVLGLGPLEDLMRDPTVTEIMVNNWDQVFVERSGLIEETDAKFTDNEQVLHVIRRIVAPIGRRVDESSPMVDARLRDGSRVNAIIPPLALNGPTLTIRRFSKDPYSLTDLVQFGALSEPMAQLLKLCVEKKKNILISGGTATGKTTLLNAVSGFIGPKERIVTIEDAAELRLHQRHVITLEARPPNVEGTGAVPIRKLVMNALRMRPDRIIVGECRGGEAFDMMQAMNTGHEGSLTTVHGNSPRDSLARIENMVLMAEMSLPSKAIRQQIASALHLIVHLSRLSDGSRRVTHITEITGMEQDVITLQDIFVFKDREITKDLKILGDYIYTGAIPRFFDTLRDRGASFKTILASAPTA